MKLRNKKTGETFNAIIREYSDGDDDYEIVVYDLDAYKRLNELPLNSAHAVISDRYKSLAELNEEWEDYEPKELKEPLIKDEWIRKAIKAWSEATGVSRVVTAHPNFDTTTIASIRDPYRQISFPNERAFLPKCKVYTIAELCGEEEE